MFKNLDLTDFWRDSDYANQHYVGSNPSDDLISQVEQRLGYRLPASYISLIRVQNGGFPKKTCFMASGATGLEQVAIDVRGFFSIGDDKPNSLLGECGQDFWSTEWGYPTNIGLAIADTPSGGHELIFLDYRACGPQGEPAVVHVDQEFGYRILHLADTFEDFIAGLTDPVESD